MHEGVQRQTVSASQDTAEAVLFSSAARPGIVALRASGPAALVGAGAPLRAAPGLPAEEGHLSGLSFVQVPVRSRRAVYRGEGARRTDRRREDRRLHTDTAMLPAASTAAREVQVAADAGFEQLLREHRAAWARRWRRLISRSVATTSSRLRRASRCSISWGARHRRVRPQSAPVAYPARATAATCSGTPTYPFSPSWPRPTRPLHAPSWNTAFAACRQPWPSHGK